MPLNVLGKICASARGRYQGNVMRWFILLILIVNFTLVFAQAVPVDLKLTINVDPPSPWPVGQVGTVRLNVTNLSETHGTVALIQAITPIPPNVLPNDGFESLGESCIRSSGCSPFGLSCIETPPIDPGATVGCEFILQAVTSRNRPRRSRHYVNHDFSFAGFIDPDLSNNTAQIELSVLSNIVPVPLSARSYASMLLLVGGIGMFAARRLR